LPTGSRRASEVRAKENTMFGTQRFTTWNPWREMQRLQNEMDRLLQGAERPVAGENPAIDVWSDENGLHVRALVPGCAREDLDVSVVGDLLTLRGALPARSLKEGESWHRREREGGKFARTLQLPFTVDADAVQARCKDGVLEVELPRAASEKPRRITVKAG
jgi:HSP20 family protein